MLQFVPHVIWRGSGREGSGGGLGGRSIAGLRHPVRILYAGILRRLAPHVGGGSGAYVGQPGYVLRNSGGSGSDVLSCGVILRASAQQPDSQIDEADDYNAGDDDRGQLAAERVLHQLFLGLGSGFGRRLFPLDEPGGAAGGEGSVFFVFGFFKLFHSQTERTLVRIFMAGLDRESAVLQPLAVPFGAELQQPALGFLIGVVAVVDIHLAV